VAAIREFHFGNLPADWQRTDAALTNRVADWKSEVKEIERKK